MFRKACHGAFMAVACSRPVRIAAGLLLVSFVTLSGPLALADEPARPEPIPNGLLCTDQMLTEPDSDDLDPIETADTVDNGSCQSSDSPVAI